jgi:hypothetical protein
MTSQKFQIVSEVKKTQFAEKEYRLSNGKYHRSTWTKEVEHREIIGEFTLLDGTPGFVEVETAYYDPDRTPRCYVSDVEIIQETVMDNLMNRRNRPHTEWTKLVMPVAKPIVEKALGMMKDLVPLTIASDWKFQWSSKAGCSMCPCSPGYIMKGVDVLDVRPRPNAKNQEYKYTGEEKVGIRVDVFTGMTHADYTAQCEAKRAEYLAKKKDEECAKLELAYLNK